MPDRVFFPDVGATIDFTNAGANTDCSDLNMAYAYGGALAAGQSKDTGIVGVTDQEGRFFYFVLASQPPQGSFVAAFSAAFA